MLRLLDFFLGDRNLYPFERSILDDVISHMGSQSGARLRLQIEAVNKIQRLCDGREVNLYQMQNGKAAFDKSLCFPNAPDEVLLASVSLKSPSGPTMLIAKVWVVQGRLFSLEFNKSPKQFFAGMNMKDAQPEIVDVEICEHNL